MPRQSALADNGPGPDLGIKRDADVGVRAVRDELKLEVRDDLPFLDNLLNFGLLGGSSREGVDEANSEGLIAIVHRAG